MRSLYILVFLFSGLVFAGDQGGNGGGGVVCRNNFGKITSVTVLDVYEAAFRKIPLEFGPKQKNPLAIIDYVLNRMAIVDPMQAEVYRKEAKEFFDPKFSNFAPKIVLPFTEDTGLVALPEGCKLEQIVLQKVPEVSEDRLFTVNKDLWDKLDTENQAALVLHEVIYRDWLRVNDGEVTIGGEEVKIISFWARYYNEYLLSSRVSKMDFFEYLDFLKKCQFVLEYQPNHREIKYQDAVYYISSLVFDEKVLQSGELSRPTLFQVGKNKFNFEGEIKFAYDGNVSEAELVGVQTVIIGGQQYNVHQAIRFQSGAVTYTKAAAKTFVQASADCSHQLEGGGIYFGDNEVLESVYSPKGICVLTKGGKWQVIENLQEATFHSNKVPKNIFTPSNSRILEVDVYEKTIPLWIQGNIFFHDNGHVSEAKIATTLGATVDLFGSDNQWHSFPTGKRLKWTSDGKVIMQP